MKKSLSILIWTFVALLGAFAYFVLATRRGEPVNSAYILTAALCSYAIGFRFYSKWIAARIMALDDRRATPCEVHEDGKDFVKTNKWIVFGHHFAAISGPGPLLGPVLAAQFGYLPGTLWIIIGVVLGGAVQDFVILFASMRRDGKSLAQMVKEELNTTAGAIGLAAILAIMIILLAVLALVVVKALAESPWGVFTVGATIPIAMFMGGYLRYWRVGKVLEVSAIGVVLLLLAVWGGQFVHADKEGWAKAFTFEAEPLAWAIIAYGFAASVFPVWLLLAPRDYLSTFMKLGTIFALAFGVFIVLPDLQMPAVTKFVDGTGLVVPGKLFPFCFITIACGAISGFHTLISSGVTPKIITRESYARPVGYGAMLLESLVAIMAMIAACTMEPGSYHGMNVASAGADSVAKAASINTKLQAAGASFMVNSAEMDRLADVVKERTLFNRPGGASTLAVGMAQIFSKVTQGRWMDLWYHFAIMFEALFILTTLDAGTRVGRYLLQDVLGNVWKPLADVKSVKANVVASALVVLGWGSFLIMGVRDPDGGVKALWPIFGIANQLLASIALCLATTVILKMALRNGAAASGPAAAGGSRSAGSAIGTPGRSPAFALVTLIPLAWLLTVTMTAGVQKIFHDDPRIGFLSMAAKQEKDLPALAQAVEAAKTGANKEVVVAAEKKLRDTRTLRFNNLLDAVIAGIFLVLVALIVLVSASEWALLLARKRLAELRETEPVWLPDYAVAEGKPVKWLGLFALALVALKELSGQNAVDRAQACAQPRVNLLGGRVAMERDARQQAYVKATEERFNGVKRCC